MVTVAETGMLVLELTCGHVEAVSELGENWLEETETGLEWTCSEGCEEAAVEGRAWRQHGVR